MDVKIRKRKQQFGKVLWLASTEMKNDMLQDKEAVLLQAGGPIFLVGLRHKWKNQARKTKTPGQNKFPAFPW